MSYKVVSRKKAHAISNGIFLVSLGILIATGLWWPGIILALWATIASRQYLSGRYYAAALSSLLLLGLFIVSFFEFKANVFVPILLVLGGGFIIFRESMNPDDTNGEETSIEILDDSNLDRKE